MKRLMARLSADHRAFHAQLDDLEHLTLDGADDATLRCSVAAMRDSIELHVRHDELLLGHLQDVSELDERTLAELQADHNRTSFLFRSIAVAEGTHLRNLCRTLTGLLRYHIGCEHTELLPLADSLADQVIPASELSSSLSA